MGRYKSQNGTEWNQLGRAPLLKTALLSFETLLIECLYQVLLMLLLLLFYRYIMRCQSTRATLFNARHHIAD